MYSGSPKDAETQKVFSLDPSVSQVLLRNIDVFIKASFVMWLDCVVSQCSFCIFENSGGFYELLNFQP